MTEGRARRPGTVSLPGVHPRCNATHVRDDILALAERTAALAELVVGGALRFAGPFHREACRDAAGRLADAVLGLAQALEDTGAAA